VIDHRRVQRTLFRMQLDPEFAAAMRSGAASEPGLGPAERDLLLTASPEALRADRNARRRAQVLGNVASEYVLTLSEAAAGPLGAGFVDRFPASVEFHVAIREERPLPLAFGAWAERCAGEAGAPVAAALASLEAAMARARREPRPAATPRASEIALSERAWLLRLPEGAFDHAQQVRAALDAGVAPPPASAVLSARAAEWLRAPRERGAEGGAGVETVLLVAEKASGRHRLRAVLPECLEPAAASLLYEAREPLSDSSLARLVASRAWSAADVAEFVDALVADGVLRRG
jgi:hypothetical protein